MKRAGMRQGTRRRFWPRLDRWGRYRLLLSALAILIAIHLAAAAWTLRERAQDTERGFRFPLPAQAAAIALLIEQTPEPDLPLVLDAVNAPDIRVAVYPERAAWSTDAVGAQRLPGVERVVQRYAEALAPLEIRVYLAADSNRDKLQEGVVVWRNRHLMSDRPLRLDIAMRDGRLLRIETRGDLTRRIFGWPLGLIAGAIGVLVALLAVRAMWRDVRPLPDLARRIDRFARAARPQPMDETGPEEIRAVIAAVNRMQTRIAGLMASRSVMLGALGHDLRTYLTRLRLRADFVEDPDQQARLINDLDSMETVIAACTTLARLEGGALEAQETALAPIFEELAREHPELRIAPAAAASEALVWGDRGAIRVALDNLVANAARYGRAEGAQSADIELALALVDDPTGASDPKAVVSVLDRGPGLAAGEEADLFKAFVRGDAARNLDAPGSGLGLAIVAAVARAHRGAARLTNRSGGGLEAQLILPAVY